MLGRCARCDKLVPVIAGDFLPNRGKQREYVPVAHSRVTHDPACEFHVELAEDATAGTCDCGKAYLVAELRSGTCPGKPIR